MNTCPAADSRYRSSPARVLPGKIGKINLSNGAYSFWEVFGLVAEDIARRGLGDEVRARLASGQTARAVILELYGIRLPATDASYYTNDTHEARFLTRRIGQRRKVV